ncbi:hypothetical protein [Sphingomonas bacterium]|uniref:hypothetical protein n=1 Tax=Sphingomonas bacterium TaxID=1895847 RepID=UPI001576895F|nr:hypothetical protein [Sphingomonas bacterium]
MYIIASPSAFSSALDPPTAPAIRSLLRLRIDLAEEAWFYIVEPGDGLPEVEQTLGFPLLVNLTGDGPAPSWEWSMDHGGCIEVAFILSDDFAHILVVLTSSEIDPALLALVRVGAIIAPTSTEAATPKG